MKNNKMTYPNGAVVVSDTRRKKDGVFVGAFKVNSIGANGEPMQNGEVFNDAKAVIVHIKAMRKLYAADLMDDETPVFPPSLFDKTKKSVFAKKHPEFQVKS